jgi:hypothetical protein
MATRSRTTFKKRQKELARLEKQRDKQARRMQRKLEKSLAAQGGGGAGPEIEGEEPEMQGEEHDPHPESPAGDLA